MLQTTKTLLGSTDWESNTADTVTSEGGEREERERERKGGEGGEKERRGKGRESGKEGTEER